MNDFGRALILDVETSGLDPTKDSILEIGVILFSYDLNQSSGFCKILKMYSGLEDPGFAIPEEIKKLTGICDEDVQGEKIAWDLIADWTQEVDFVVAHNASFDKSFVNAHEVLNPFFKNKMWLCTLKHPDWEALSIQTRKLQYLASELGFVNPFPHRALSDCLTTFKIAERFLKQMIQRSQEKEILIRAVGAAYSVKDLLKQRGYQWNKSLSVWQKTVLESGLALERDFLSREVYSGKSSVHEEVVVLL
jgi:DNA polymerase-3 subunit epsilon